MRICFCEVGGWWPHLKISYLLFCHDSIVCFCVVVLFNVVVDVSKKITGDSKLEILRDPIQS